MTSDNNNKPGMTSSQPYLIRAIYEWIVDNNLTPYLMVDATKRGTIVPEDYLDEQGRIILNISPNATSGLLMTNEEVTFSARFSGQSIGIVVPTFSVRAIYARENGQGMIFDENKESTGVKEASKKVALQAVAGGDAGDAPAAVKDSSKGSDKKPAGRREKKTVESKDGPDDPPKDPGSKKGKKGPHLKVIK